MLIESQEGTLRTRESNEDTLIRKIRHCLGRSVPTSSSSLRLGIGDDAAIFIPSPGHETILTCDWFLEGTHFRRNHPADSIGWKCLARAASDIAAMGALPRCFLLSLGLPATHTRHWLDEFLGGLLRASRRFACAIAGGDTTRRSDILIHVTVIGEIVKGRAVLRSGARPGDLIYVSGTLGEAELGLRRVRSSRRRADKNDPVLRKHLCPEPRLALGRWLAENALATAMMDLSDGLSSDLPRICSASVVGARVEARSVPVVSISPREVSRGFAPVQFALHGGDDYELLFTVPPRKARLIPRSFEGVPLTAIGEVTRGSQVLLIGEHGREERLRVGGWDPFRAFGKGKSAPR